MKERNQGSVAPAFGLVVGAVAATVASARDNWGRAVFGVVAGAGISLALCVTRAPMGA